MPFEPVDALGGFTASPALPSQPELEGDSTLATVGKVAAPLAIGAGLLFAPEFTIPALAAGGLGAAIADPEATKAAFRTENTIGSVLASRSMGDDSQRDPNFDPWAEIADTPYEPYFEQLAHARSKSHFEAIKGDIDRENKDRDTIAKSGIVGMGASMAAGVLDLPSAMPGAVVLRQAKGGVSMLRTAAATAAAGTGAAVASEAVLQQSQQLRTAGESAIVIAGSAVLSGLLGAGLGRRMARQEFDGLAARVERDFTVPGPGEPDPFIPGSMRPSVEAVQGASEKARSVADAIRETAEEILPAQVRVQVVDSLGPVGDDGVFSLRGVAERELSEIFDEFNVKDIAELRQRAAELPDDIRNLKRLSDEIDKLDNQDIERHYGVGYEGRVSDYPSSRESEVAQSAYNAILAKYRADDAEYITEFAKHELKPKLRKAEKFAERLARSGGDGGRFSLRAPNMADVSFTGSGARARAIGEDGKEIGFVSGTVSDGVLIVDKTTLPETHQGKGYGVAMYRALIDAALDRGLRVESAYEVSEKASRVYDALARRGYKVERLPYRIEKKSGGRRLVVTDDLTRRPIAVTRKPEVAAREQLFSLRAKRYTAPEVETPDQIGDALKTIRETVADAGTAPLTGRFAPDDLQQRFTAYKKADTDLRAALIGGLDPEDALARYAKLRGEAEALVNDMRKTDARINRDIEKDMKARAGGEEMFSLRQSQDQPRTPTEVKGFHGTPLGAIERFRSENASEAHDGAFFFTSRSEGTSPYTGEAYLDSPFDLGMQPTVYPTFVETKGFKEIDWKGQTHNDGVGPSGGDLNAEMALAKKEGFPGLVVKNMDEAGGDQDWFITWTPDTVRSALSEAQMFARRASPEGPIAEGKFDPETLLITIAADALDPAKTLRHESIHALKTMGLFTGKDWGTLEAAAKSGKWLETNNIKALYEGVYKDRITDELLLEEAIAEQFSLWRQGAIQVKGVIAKLFERIQQFLEATGNALRGRGFQTADDVFAAVRSGEVASRAPGGAPSAAGAIPAAGIGRATSAGASAVTRAEDTLKSALGLEKAFYWQDPMLRLQTSLSPASKRHVQELAETPLAYAKNELGEPTAPEGSQMGAPGAVETRMKFWQGPLAESVQTVDDAFLKYRKGHAKRFTGETVMLNLKDTMFGTQALTFRGFKEEIARAMRRGDNHAIPEVAEAARFIRKRLIEPLKDEAIGANLLPEDVTVETADSYLTRLYNKDLIIAERDQFKAIVQNWLEAGESAARGQRNRLSDLVNRLDDAQTRVERIEERVAQAPKTSKKIDRKAIKAQTDEAKAEIADLLKAIERELGPQAKTAPRADGETPKTPKEKPALARARAALDQVDREPGEIADLADQIIDRILGTPDGRLPYDGHMDRQTIGSGKYAFQIEKRGPLAAREFMIPDAAIERYLENDIETVLRAYTRTMAADVEIGKRFGDLNLELQRKEIVEDYARLSAQAKTPAERKKLDTLKNRDIRDLAAIRDRLRGTYALPKNPDGILVRSGRVINSLNYMRMLGGMTISAIPDTARTVMVHGLMRTAGDGLVPLLRNWSGARLAMTEVKLAGTALDMVLDSRAMQIADVMDDFGRHSKFERAVQTGARNFGVISLMAPWNAAMKQFAGLVTMTRMLRAVERIAAGNGRPKEVAMLASGGISEANARKIAAQFAKHGKKEGGVWHANTAAWEERSAIEAFRAALVRDVDRIIVTPGQERPLWMSTETGRLIGQFKSFSISAMQRVLISGLQQRDMATLNGAIMMVALGGLASVIRAKTGGQPIPDLSDRQKQSQFLVEAIDRSGLTGWMMEANSMTEKLTRGAVGLSAITGKPVSRYASRNISSALMGPTAGTIQDFTRVVGAAASGEWNQSDSRVMRRLIPYNNIFYLRQMFDQAEGGINDFFGVPKPAGARR